MYWHLMLAIFRIATSTRWAPTGNTRPTTFQPLTRKSKQGIKKTWKSEKSTTTCYVLRIAREDILLGRPRAKFTHSDQKAPEGEVWARGKWLSGSFWAQSGGNRIFRGPTNWLWENTELCFPSHQAMLIFPNCALIGGWFRSWLGGLEVCRAHK